MAASAVTSAVRRRCAGSSPSVIARNKGMLPTGFMMASNATKQVTMFRLDVIAARPLPQSGGRLSASHPARRGGQPYKAETR